MRLISVLLAPKQSAARRPQVEPVQFQELLPLRLKKSVSGKNEKSSDPVCLQEMALMFSCLKKNEFNQKSCTNEVQSFKKCFADFEATAAVTKQQAKKGILIPGENKMTHKQVNKLLQSFPPPKSKPKRL